MSAAESRPECSCTNPPGPRSRPICAAPAPSSCPGSVEQHGPTGLLGTDAICAERIAAAAGELTGALVAPTFNVGMAQHHMAFPGTITLRPSTMIAAVVDWCNALARHGFDRLYWLNGHGGNVSTLDAAFSEAHAAASLSAAAPARPRRLRLSNWWELAGVAELGAELFPIGEGEHATATEVSVTFHAYPAAAARAVAMTPKVAPPLAPFGDAWDFRRQFPDGRVGSDPSQASAEDGRRLIDVAARALAAEFAAFEAA